MFCGLKLGLQTYNSQAYADDLTLISPTSGGLQILLDKITIMLKNLNLSVNIDKTACVVFRKNNKHYLDPVITIGENIMMCKKKL